MSVQIDILGVKGVNKDLLAAARRYRSKAHTRKLLRPAAQMYRDRLSAEVGATAWKTGKDGKPKNSTGNLKRSIRTFSFRKSFGVHVGPRVGATERRGLADGYYFGWQNYGTKRGIKGHMWIEKTLRKHGSMISAKAASALIDDLKYLQ